MYNQCLPQGKDRGFGKTLKSAVAQGDYVNRFAGLLATFLCRYTYAGDVLNLLDEKPELANTTICIDVTCTNPSQDFGDEIGDLFDEKTHFSFKINPKYCLLLDTYNWESQGKPIGLFQIPLGPGGTSLPRVARGFNTLLYRTAEEYELLVTGRNGKFPPDVRKSIEGISDEVVSRNQWYIPHYCSNTSF